MDLWTSGQSWTVWISPVDHGDRWPVSYFLIHRPFPVLTRTLFFFSLQKELQINKTDKSILMKSWLCSGYHPPLEKKIIYKLTKNRACYFIKANDPEEQSEGSRHTENNSFSLQFHTLINFFPELSWTSPTANVCHETISPELQVHKRLSSSI